LSKTPIEQRRFIVGAIVDEKKDAEIIEKMKIEDYKLFQLPKAVQSVYTTFPFTSVFSVPIANMKVPSRMREFTKVEYLHTIRLLKQSQLLLD